MVLKCLLKNGDYYHFVGDYDQKDFLYNIIGIGYGYLFYRDAICND